MNPKSDFFISYTKNDKAWAEWIAWELEESGYTTILQAWDFLPGSNFVLQMNDATGKAERTIAILSPDYFSASFTKAEWAAAFADDPGSEKGTLIPIRIRKYEDKGLLPQIIYIDLVGRDESSAKEVLLKGIQRERAKPAIKPNFPGSAERTIIDQPVFPGLSAKRIKISKKLIEGLFSALLMLGFLGGIGYFFVREIFWDRLLWLRNVPLLLESDFNDEVATSKVPVLLFFYTSTSDTCRTVAPAISEVAKEYGNKIKVFKVDADINRQLSEKLNADYSKTPMLILFIGGNEQYRLAGAVSKIALAKMVDSSLQKKFDLGNGTGKNPIIEAYVVNLVESDFKEEVLNASLPVMVLVGAQYDTAFGYTKPLIEEIAKEYVGKVKVVIIERGLNQRLAHELGLPYDTGIIYYKRGKEQKRLIGAASKDAITRILNKML